MSDLERLTEALERWREAEATSNGFVLDYEQEIEAHLLAYRDLLANGRRVEWCETHRREAPATAHCDSSQHIAMEPCRIISKLLSVYPKEAENDTE